MSYFLSELQLSPSATRVKVQVLRKGQWQHPSAPNGVLKIDDHTLDALEQAFRSGVRGSELPVNLDHKHDSFVVGWLRDLQREGDALVGYVDVVDKEVAHAIHDQKLRYSSAEILFHYVDPETQQEYPAVLKGLAFTNYPFIKQMQPAEVVNLSEVEEVQHMEERLEQLERQKKEMQDTIARLREENAKLRETNDVLLMENRRQQDEMLLKDYENTIPPSVRKVVSALLALTRGEEVQLSEFRDDANRPADLRDLVFLLINEFRALQPRQTELTDVRIPERRTVGTNTEQLLQQAEELSRQRNIEFGQAIRLVMKNAKGVS